MKDQKLILINIMKGILEHYQEMAECAESEEDTVAKRHYLKRIRKAEAMLNTIQTYVGDQ